MNSPIRISYFITHSTRRTELHCARVMLSTQPVDLRLLQLVHSHDVGINLATQKAMFLGDMDGLGS